MLGLNASFLNDDKAALRLFEQSHALHEQAKDRYCVGLCALGLGLITLRLGDHRKARDRLKEALTTFQEIGAEWGTAEAVLGLASLTLAEGNPKRAARLWAGVSRKQG